MLQKILDTSIESGILDTNLSLDDFKKRRVQQTSVVVESCSMKDAVLYMLTETEGRSLLVILTCYNELLSGFSGESISRHKGNKVYYALECPLDHRNAVQLRKNIPHTAPSVLSCTRSFGMGDRIGGKASATPWHVDACQGYDITPVFAQQSIRENQKTGRTFLQVLDDATWAVFQTGFKLPWGADADHLKSPEDLDDAVHAGFTMFTIDPSDLIDNNADADSETILKQKLNRLFPNPREIDMFISRYEGRHTKNDLTVVRSGVKYLSAVRYVVEAYRRLSDLLGESGFNFELSIDETTTSTSPLDHRIIIGELEHEGVNLFSLAPRFEGAFEKGIDYRGSLDDFRKSLTAHVTIARERGGYRLSLHSGSDKFSIYPIFGEVTDGFFHVKTAGTSYLEAVKAAAEADMDLFRRILTLSVETFHINASSYHISADINRVPRPSEISRDDAIELITNNPDVRQVLHIAFGVVLTQMGDEFKTVLHNNRHLYRDYVVAHIKKHLALLTANSSG